MRKNFSNFLYFSESLNFIKSWLFSKIIQCVFQYSSRQVPQYTKKTFEFIYRMCSIITRALYKTFYPLFEVHLCTVTFGLMYGYYSRAVSNQERVIVARTTVLIWTSLSCTATCLVVSFVVKLIHKTVYGSRDSAWRTFLWEKFAQHFSWSWNLHLDEMIT